ncbi:MULTISPECIES: ATP synthase F1 subunit epsilon [unclassified Bacteroides]|jgi:F-type H+-transporting ATPase subunit epsilon|uniref:ATP synthase F1 subunit epsilon n=1 Tax=unclassified Bacteroides TaxID=2646097 RepID=UPI0015B508E1|nr:MULTISPECIES: ATP synthase F1 subunit epsilon [unclassified Bacteroides]
MKLQILQLTIVSPEHILFEGDVQLVTLPGTLGSFTVLPDHAPIISSLENGEITFSADGEMKSIEIKGGFVEVKDNLISICVEQ